MALKKAMRDASLRISDLFTRSRCDIGGDYFDRCELRAAYLAHFTLTNAWKVYRCLREADSAIGIKDRYNILDLGCGSGGAAIAAASFLKGKNHKAILDISLVDKNKHILRDASFIFDDLAFDNTKIRLGCLDALAAPRAKHTTKDKYDLILLSNTLNELGSENQEKFLTRLLSDDLADDGIIIIIDPALKGTSRRLAELRNFATDRLGACVLSPCLHQKPCPMLAKNARDWCHFYIEWERPELIRMMDEMVGTDHTYLKMSYLVMGHMASQPYVPGSGGVVGRAVSSPLLTKGKIEISVCTEGGELVRLARQNKDESGENSDFATSKRGDVVACDGALKIKKDNSYKIIEQWDSPRRQP
jgi:ribosomal protein RSM22 (predicted rRNA methylase)